MGVQNEILARLLRQLPVVTTSDLLERVYQLIAESGSSVDDVLSRLPPRTSTEAVVRALVELVAKGQVRTEFEVRSLDGTTGLGSFAQLAEIPKMIYDPVSSQSLPVTPDRLRTVFRHAGS